jgi:hypothetical protein
VLSPTIVDITIDNAVASMQQQTMSTTAQHHQQQQQQQQERQQRAHMQQGKTHCVRQRTHRVQIDMASNWPHNSDSKWHSTTPPWCNNSSSR